MKKILLLSFTLSLFFVTNINPQNNTHPKNIISKKNIKINLEVLASDLFEGREATTRGEKLSQLYIISQLKKAGVKPYFKDGYLQKFKLNSQKMDEDTKITLTDNKGNTTKFDFIKDFIISSRSSYHNNDYKANLVFVGFGITAPEYKYDDYKNLNVKDKFVVVINGEPSGGNAKYFNGKEDSKYSKNKSKIANAKKHGAKGIIFLASKRLQSFWSRLAIFLKRPSFSLVNKESNNKKEFIMAYFSKDAFSKLFSTQNIKAQYLINQAKEGLSITPKEFDGTLNMNLKRVVTKKNSANIVGVIEGNDPKLKNEYVAIGGHYDHLGIINGKVYNGADDDGSGTVTVMEVAKAFAKTKSNKRSILVVFHAGEEKGLLGSSYLTNNLDLIKENKIVAQINIDMVGRESVDTLYSVGSAKLSKELKKVTEEVNKSTVNFVFNYKFDDPKDPQRIYYRSDHYNYAKHGIPIVFFTDNMNKDYHKYTDDVEKINFDKMFKVSTLVYNLANKISNLDHRLVVDKQK